MNGSDEMHQAEAGSRRKSKTSMEGVTIMRELSGTDLRRRDFLRYDRLIVAVTC
jgi:hypothetical protein